jgi:hypothetical protein
MRDSRKVIQPSNNGQKAVDEKKQVIIVADISQNATDHVKQRPLVEQVERNFGALPKEDSADVRYLSYDNLEFAEGKGLDINMPDNFLESLDEKEENEKRYHKGNFCCDEVRDTYICPEGKELKRWAGQKREEKSSLLLYRGESCMECVVKERCTTWEVRTVSRDGWELLLEAMRDKLRSEEGRQIYKKRAYTVEPVFGQLK